MIGAASARMAGVVATTRDVDRTAVEDAAAEVTSTLLAP
jgi:hypothetical protein